MISKRDVSSILAIILIFISTTACVSKKDAEQQTTQAEQRAQKQPKKSPDSSADELDKQFTYTTHGKSYECSENIGGNFIKKKRQLALKCISKASTLLLYINVGKHLKTGTFDFITEDKFYDCDAAKDECIGKGLAHEISPSGATVNTLKSAGGIFEITKANIGEFDGAMADARISGSFSIQGENQDGDIGDINGEFKNIKLPVVDIQK